MNFEIVDGFRYAESHEWLDERDDVVRIGITDFAQDELGDIVFVDLPEEGDTFERDESFGVVESIKAVSDLYVPVAGKVTAINDDLLGAPELINDDPFGDGWIIEVSPSEPIDGLLDPTEYQQVI